MIFIDNSIKADPVQRWNLDDKIFFAAGACHILAYAFLQKFNNKGFKPLWIRPADGYRGNHIIVTNDKLVFDYQGMNNCKRYFKTLEMEMSTREEEEFKGWKYDLREFPNGFLISEKESKAYGLWLREPGQFLHNPIPRAFQYLNQFNLETII